jgi:aminodeoxyfutalosine synthase
MAADELKRSAVGNIVTYLRVHDLSAGPQGIPAAAAEVRLYSTPASFAVAVAQVQSMATPGGRRRVAAFSWVDLVDRGWNDSAHLGALVHAGLQDVAELPVDRVDDISEAVDRLLEAGAVPQRLTVSHPAGDRRVEILTRVQAAFAAHPTLRRFSPLPRVAPVDKPTTGYDDVRMVALARLALNDRSVEVDWRLYGPKLAQVALTFGADHLDAVSAVDDTSLGPRRTTIEDVERNIKAAGFVPQEYRPA